MIVEFGGVIKERYFPQLLHSVKLLVTGCTTSVLFSVEVFAFIFIVVSSVAYPAFYPVDSSASICLK
jgi:predicted nucleic-acid-binding Zn-ribbon protein